jgi:PIF1-like helicase
LVFSFKDQYIRLRAALLQYSVGRKGENNLTLSIIVQVKSTGVAASLIGGKTTHTVAGISERASGNMSHVTKSKLQSYWKSKAYLIIDEFSTISKSFLSKIERNVSIGKQGSQIFPDWTFGGLNVVLCGDLHQFPPVAKGSGEFFSRRTSQE